MRRARSIFVGFWVGLMLASGTTALAAAGWSWYTEVEGSASGTLGALSPLDVTDARGGEGLFPGEVLPLRVDIGNPNRVDLTLVSVDIGDLESGDGACDESLKDSRFRFDRTPDILIHPGKNDGIVLGKVRLPDLLAQSCQGKDIEADVTAKAAFGVK